VPEKAKSYSNNQEPNNSKTSYKSQRKQEEKHLPGNLDISEKTINKARITPNTLSARRQARFQYGLKSSPLCSRPLCL
jgi:hypothetical protein